MFCGRIAEDPLGFPWFSVLNSPMCASAPQTQVRGCDIAWFAVTKPPSEAKMLRPPRRNMSIAHTTMLMGRACAILLDSFWWLLKPYGS
jgi:hypothetical protein